MRFGTCRQVKREEAAVRRNPMDAALIRAILEQFLTMGAAQAMQQLAYIHGEVSKVYDGQHRPEPTAPEREAGAEEKEAWEEEWDDERMANGWYESAAYGSAVGPAEGSDDVGGSLGRRKSQHSKKWNTRS